MQNSEDDSGTDGDQHHAATDLPPLVVVLVRQLFQSLGVETLAIALGQWLAFLDMHAW